MNRYVVYWIRYDHHTDPMTEGYIGISGNPKRRELTHKYGKNLQVPRAMENGASMQILHEQLSRDEALHIEAVYRPQELIGWNLVAGGGAPPSCVGRLCSEQTRQKKSASTKGKPRPITSEHKNAIASAQAKKVKRAEQAQRWLITKPDETQEEIINLALYCRTHGLRKNNMSNVATGREKSHRGYRVIKLAKA